MSFIRKVGLKLKDALINPYQGFLPKSEFNRIRRMPRLQHGQTTLFGHQVQFSDNNGFLCSLREIFVDNQNKIRLETSSPFIIDCGSNIGLSILYLKKQFPAAEIIGFEPDKAIFEILQQNIKESGVPGVTLHNAAVWIKDEMLDFFSDGSLAGSLAVDISKDRRVSTVKAIRLKNILQQRKTDFLKIDIEGAENDLLFDIADELKNVDYLFLEYHSIPGKEQKLGEILQLLTNAAFRFYIKNHNDYLKYPFYDTRSDGFDMQLSIFCFKK